MARRGDRPLAASRARARPPAVPRGPRGRRARRAPRRRHRRNSIDGAAATTHEVPSGSRAAAPEKRSRARRTARCSRSRARRRSASTSWWPTALGAGARGALARAIAAHARALALASSASAGVAVAVGGAPGLLLFGDAAAAAAAPTASAGEQREGVLLHRGAVVVCCSFCASAERLAVATLDGRLLVHRAAAAGWQRGPPALIWSARLPCERACCLSWSDDGRWIAVASWQADVALYDAAEYAADGAPPPLGAGATVGAAATAARRRAQEWRLATVRAPQQPQPAGPVVQVWAAAPHAAGTLVCAQPAAPAAPAQSGGRRAAAAARGVAGGGRTARRAPGFAPLPAGAQLRGLCSGRAGASERLCWLDAQGVLRWRSLWPWAPRGGRRRGAGRGGRRRAAAAGRAAAARRGCGWRGEVCELPAASADACIDAWRGGAPAVWPRLATGVAHAAVLHRRLVQVRPRGGGGGAMALAASDGRPPRRLHRGRAHAAAAAARWSPRPQARRCRRRASAPPRARSTRPRSRPRSAAAPRSTAPNSSPTRRDGGRFVLLARDAPPASAALPRALGDAPPGGAPALREPAATPLARPGAAAAAARVRRGRRRPPPLPPRRRRRRHVDRVRPRARELRRREVSRGLGGGGGARAGERPSLIYTAVPTPRYSMCSAYSSLGPRRRSGSTRARQGGADAADAARAPVGRRAPDAQLGEHLRLQPPATTSFLLASFMARSPPRRRARALSRHRRCSLIAASFSCLCVRILPTRPGTSYRRSRRENGVQIREQLGADEEAEHAVGIVDKVGVLVRVRPEALQPDDGGDGAHQRRAARPRRPRSSTHASRCCENGFSPIASHVSSHAGPKRTRKARKSSPMVVCRRRWAVSKKRRGTDASTSTDDGPRSRPTCFVALVDVRRQRRRHVRRVPHRRRAPERRQHRPRTPPPPRDTPPPRRRPTRQDVFAQGRRRAASTRRAHSPRACPWRAAAGSSPAGAWGASSPAVAARSSRRAAGAAAAARRHRRRDARRRRAARARGGGGACGGEVLAAPSPRGHPARSTAATSRRRVCGGGRGGGRRRRGRRSGGARAGDGGGRSPAGGAKGTKSRVASRSARKAGGLRRRRRRGGGGKPRRLVARGGGLRRWPRPSEAFERTRGRGVAPGRTWRRALRRRRRGGVEQLRSSEGRAAGGASRRSCIKRGGAATAGEQKVDDGARSTRTPLVAPSCAARLIKTSGRRRRERREARGSAAVPRGDGGGLSSRSGGQSVAAPAAASAAAATPTAAAGSLLCCGRRDGGLGRRRVGRPAWRKESAGMCSSSWSGEYLRASGRRSAARRRCAEFARVRAELRQRRRRRGPRCSVPRVDERLVGVDAGARPVELVHLLRDQGSETPVRARMPAAVEEAVLQAADDLGRSARARRRPASRPRRRTRRRRTPRRTTATSGEREQPALDARRGLHGADGGFRSRPCTPGAGKELRGG